MAGPAAGILVQLIGGAAVEKLTDGLNNVVNRFGALVKTLTNFNTIARVGTSAARAIGTSMIFAGGAFRDLGVAINVAASLFQTLIPIISAVTDSLGYFSVLLLPIAGQLTISAAAFAGFVAGMKQIIETGITFNASLEKNIVTVATLIVQYKDLVLANGAVVGQIKEYTEAQFKSLTADERALHLKNLSVATTVKMFFAMRQAKGAVLELTKAAADSQFTTTQLLSAFQATFSVLGQYNVSSKKAAELTGQFARVAAVAGVSAANLGSQLTLFLTGSGRITSPLARFMGMIGLGKEQMKAFGAELKAASGDLSKTNAILDTMTFKLVAFNVGGRLMSDTWTGIMSNMGELFELFAGQVTEGLFNKIRDSIFKFDIDVQKALTDIGNGVQNLEASVVGVSGVLSQLFNIDPTTGTFYKTIDSLEDLFSGLRIETKKIFDFEEAHWRAVNQNLKVGTAAYDEFINRLLKEGNIYTLKEAQQKALSAGLEKESTQYNEYIKKLTTVGETSKRMATAQEAYAKVSNDARLAGLGLTQQQIADLVVLERGMQPVLAFFKDIMNLLSDDIVDVIGRIGVWILSIGQQLYDQRLLVFDVYDSFKDIFRILGDVVGMVLEWFGIKTDTLGVIHSIRATLKAIVIIIAVIGEGINLARLGWNYFVQGLYVAQSGLENLYNLTKFIGQQLKNAGGLIASVFTSIASGSTAPLTAAIAEFKDTSKELGDSMDATSAKLKVNLASTALEIQKGQNAMGTFLASARKLNSEQGLGPKKSREKNWLDDLMERLRKGDGSAGDGDKKSKVAKEAAEVEKGLYKEITAALQAEIGFRKALIERELANTENTLNRMSNLLDDQIKNRERNWLGGGDVKNSIAVRAVQEELKARQALFVEDEKMRVKTIDNIKIEAEFTDKNLSNKIKVETDSIKRNNLIVEQVRERAIASLKLTEEERNQHEAKVKQIQLEENLEHKITEVIREQRQARREALEAFESDLRGVASELESLTGAGIQARLNSLNFDSEPQYIKILDTITRAKQRINEISKSGVPIDAATARTNAEILAYLESQKVNYMQLVELKRGALFVEQQQREIAREKVKFDLDSENIQKRVAAGYISDEQAILKVSDAALNYQGFTRQRMQDLLDYAEAVKTVAPEIATQIGQMYKEWSKLSEVQDKNAAELRNAYRDGFKGFFDTIQNDITDVGSAFTNLGNSILKTFQGLISKKLSEQLFNSLFGDGDKKKGLFGNFFGGLSTGTGGTKRDGTELESNAARGNDIIMGLRTGFGELQATLTRNGLLNPDEKQILKGSESALQDFNKGTSTKIEALTTSITDRFPKLGGVLERSIVAIEKLLGPISESRTTQMTEGLGIAPTNRPGRDAKDLKLSQAEVNNLQYAANYLKNKGVSESSVLALLTNATREMGGFKNFTNTHKDESNKVKNQGIFSFQGGYLKDKDLKAALALGDSRAGLKAQLDFFLKDVAPKFGPDLTNAQSIPDAFKAFGNFERYAGYNGTRSRNPFNVALTQPNADHGFNTTFDINRNQDYASVVSPFLGAKTGQTPTSTTPTPVSVETASTEVVKALAGGTEVAKEVEATTKLTTATTEVKTGVDGVKSALGSGLKGELSTFATNLGLFLETNVVTPIVAAIGSVFTTSAANIVPAQKAFGGYISGPGGPTEDKIPAWLSNGEYVIKAAAVKALGMNKLHALNNADKELPQFGIGGFLGGAFKSLGKFLKGDTGKMILSTVAPMLLQKFLPKGAKKYAGLISMGLMGSLNGAFGKNTPKYSNSSPAVTDNYRGISKDKVWGMPSLRASGGLIGKFAGGGLAHKMFGGSLPALADGGGGFWSSPNGEAVKSGGISAAISIGMALLGRWAANKRKKKELEDYKKNRTKDPFGMNPDTLTFYKKPMISGSRNWLAKGGPITSAMMLRNMPKFAMGGGVGSGGMAGVNLDEIIRDVDMGDNPMTVNQNINITTPDVHSFRNSRGQLERDLARVTQRGMKRRAPKY